MKSRTGPSVWAVPALCVFMIACGARNGLVVVGSADAPEDAALDAFDDLVELDEGIDLDQIDEGDAADLVDADAGLECPGVCMTGCQLFYDGFEGGTGDWELGGVWAADGIAMEGDTSLHGYWNRLGGGCPVTSAAKMSSDVDLRGAGAATLRFFQTGFFAEFDTLRVIVSTDGGGLWVTAATPDPLPLDTATWNEQVIDLSPWIGRPRVRFGFEFDNICGDPYGVDWYIDEVSICSQ